jgi:hypothetical protein
MPKRTSTKRPTDINQVANFLVVQTTEEKPFVAHSEPPKVVSKAVSRIMAQMGSRGGKIGGKRRLEMPPERRRQLASDAAKARWAKAKNAEG